MDTLKSDGGTQKKRMYYLDTLKVLLICLVIGQHASQPYGPTGGAWVYHNSNGIIQWLGNFMAVNMAFLMGLFFMISGYFLPASFKGQTLGCFIGKKLNRLMTPVLIILVAIVPVYFYIAAMLHAPSRVGFFEYYINTYWGTFIVSYEHGWYLLHLFFYSVIYGVAKTLLKNRKEAAARPFKTYYVVILALLVSAVSYFVRLVFPIDRWIRLLGFIALEPAHLPQYVLFFSFGIIAYKNNYFETIPRKTGCVLAGMGIGMALLLYLSGWIGINDLIWRYWVLYESFMAAFLAVGLIVVFREFCNRTGPLQKILGRSAFVAYILHNLFVVPIQVLLDSSPLGPWARFILVTVLSIILAFASAHLFLQGKSAVRKLWNKRNTGTAISG